ncbi:hypothetical protein WJX72_004592 [[Myrmecia] bisecta]|uniref:Glycoside hydrolase family 5 domain-containing protein n=1 Tax=[Myrmecia] bisecta TaxID=41462 RepID=A0AAW1PCS6_9CHLO
MDGATEVQLKSVALSGFELLGGKTINGDLSQGSNSISKDFRTTVYRQALLGFNAVRLEWSNEALQASPVNYAQPGCTIASQSDILASLTPPGQNAPSSAPFSAPPIDGGICSKFLPNTGTYDRFTSVASYYATQGFYVGLVYHTYKTGQGYYVDYSTTSNLNSWVASWVNMVKTVLTKGAPGSHLLIDLMNEPDVYDATWSSGGALPSSLSDYYLAAMDAISAVCPDCLFLIQGAGQYRSAPQANWGDGYAQNGPNPPTTFFNTLMGKSYLKQVVIAPHVYCPSVTGQPMNVASGQGLKDRMTQSFGYLATTGWCSGSTCHKFPIMVGEFNFNPDNSNDLQCYSSFSEYVNSQGITSWSVWAWDANSDMQYGNGGLVLMSDWRSINWNKLEKLATIGLMPWFTSSFKAPAGATSQTPAASIETPAATSTGTVAADPSVLPGSRSVASTPTRAVAEGVITVSGSGSTPFGTGKQTLLIQALGASLSTITVMDVSTNTASTQVILDETASKATGAQDGDNTSDVSVHLEAMTMNTALFPQAITSAINSGAVANALNTKTGMTWIGIEDGAVDVAAKPQRGTETNVGVHASSAV